jgi:hypothetical protein
MGEQKMRTISKTRSLFRIIFTSKVLRLFKDPIFSGPSFEAWNACNLSWDARTADWFERDFDAFEERLFGGSNPDEQSRRGDS